MSKGTKQKRLRWLEARVHDAEKRVVKAAVAAVGAVPGRRSGMSASAIRKQFLAWDELVAEVDGLLANRELAEEARKP